jgi:DNA-binding NarL/FixJ family response regulator
MVLDGGLATGEFWLEEPAMIPLSMLIVDDSKALLRALARFLKENYRDDVTVVGVAGGGKEALVKAQELHPQVILLDLTMPGMHGLEVVPRLREILPEICIITMSLLDLTEYREASLAAGADDFVPKAMLGTHRLPAIWRVLQSGRWRGKPGEVPGVLSR